jgi:outer membrane protein TolC
MQSPKHPTRIRQPTSLIEVFWFFCCATIGLLCSSTSAAPVTNNFPTQPISLADAVNQALTLNPNIRRAQRDLEASQGVVIQTRAIAVPKVRVTGSYDAKQSSNVDVISTNGFNLGSDQNWDSQIRVVQSLYEGGRIASSLRVAKLTKEQALLNYQTSVADTVVDVQVAYFDVLLAEQQIIVQEASVELLSRELADTKRRFDAGTVPSFNVLRAEVELANAQPKLIRARNSFRIAKNNLANLLGFNIPRETFEDIPLKLSGKLEAVPYEMELPRAITLALEQRTELGALRKAESLRKEDIVNARASYKPSLQVYAGYEGHNSILQNDLNTDLHGWIAGAQLSWDIFDGGLAHGKIKQARALQEKAEVDLEDAGRRIELEVRTAFSNFREADEVLKSQEKAVEEGEEALRLAKMRNEAGTATQLDVLSAQTALTEARTTQVQALHDYAVARARLERSVGASIQGK